MKADRLILRRKPDSFLIADDTASAPVRFECFASTGVNTTETMFEPLMFRLSAQRHPATRWAGWSRSCG